MKERGILMQPEMVRATWAGTKTQTRRVANTGLYAIDAEFHGAESAARELAALVEHCPYGVPGDRLWVREAFRTYLTYHGESMGQMQERLACSDEQMRGVVPIQYEADSERRNWIVTSELPGRYRHARFMPRWASRILLEVTGVRVERLQAISEADCIAEGIEQNWLGDLAQGNNGFGGQGWTPDNGWKHYTNSIDGDPAFTPLESYRSLWESINGPGSWALNPWVWVVEFRKVTP